MIEKLKAQSLGDAFHKRSLGMGHRQGKRDRFLHLVLMSMALYGFMNISVKLIPCGSFYEKLKTKVLAWGKEPHRLKCPNAKEMYYFLSVPGMYHINFLKKSTFVIFS